MRPFLMTSIATIGMMTASCAEAGPTTTLSKSEIETLVKEYILENPEIIRDAIIKLQEKEIQDCLLYTSPSPRDRTRSRMPSSA